MKTVTHKTLFALSLSAVCFVSAAGFFILLAYSLGVYESRLWTASADLAYREAAADQELSLERLLAETADDRAALEALVLAEADVAAFLSETERVGRALGLTVRTASVAQAAIPNTDLFEYVVLQLELTGSLDEVETMIALLGSFPYRIVVDRALLSRVAEEGSESWRGVVDLSVSAYKAPSS